MLGLGVGRWWGFSLLGQIFFSIWTGFSMLSVCAISHTMLSCSCSIYMGEGALGPWFFGSPCCRGDCLSYDHLQRRWALGLLPGTSEALIPNSNVPLTILKRYKPHLILLQETNLQGSWVLSLKRAHVAGAYHASFSSYGFYTGHKSYAHLHTCS